MQKRIQGAWTSRGISLIWETLFTVIMKSQAKRKDPNPSKSLRSQEWGICEGCIVTSLFQASEGTLYLSQCPDLVRLKLIHNTSYMMPSRLTCYFTEKELPWSTPHACQGAASHPPAFDSANCYCAMPFPTAHHVQPPSASFFGIAQLERDESKRWLHLHSLTRRF